MDKFTSKNGFYKDLNLSESKADADGRKNECYLDNTNANDSAFMNQSIIISGSAINVNCGIQDISNNLNDELNTNIDALMLNKKEGILKDKSQVDPLNTNVVETLKSHSKPGLATLLNSTNMPDLNKTKDLGVAEKPEVEVTSQEESNGKFRVKFHIKGFKK